MGLFRRSAPPPAVERIFEKLLRLIQDDSTQNETLHPSIRERVIGGASVDQIAGATGEFGRTLTNPVPVNGPVGEISYLSRLRTSAGHRIFGHRLGAIQNVDVFETVSFDGAVWDILMLSLYHPRKSRMAPGGYWLESPEKVNTLFSATNDFVDPFPSSLGQALRATGEKMGAPVFMPPSELQGTLGVKPFRRPQDHQEKVATLINYMRSR
ncbi:MAG: hypothetical protein E5V60_01190 [Mesorhizobium sp.]|uniref:hypothetical protein n=1 Tax=Mesorhizobium sp. M4A.F.Ca.ET.090.04.2.1 TaxID=2496663 RepID=UPI000FC9E54A|nr:hypothetical protein [Mesorhizobium sp. M4A.F.Ca.ET.090.04.2.1]RVC47463.1 hypothetical protein EN781_01045 [Mesorhizobium sp. M4A.F.Ca.ET.090.04.2.1]TIW69334.1 MAG: hypothetical protein E5V60_01190 [Mesorhizobium sp.]